MFEQLSFLSPSIPVGIIVPDPYAYRRYLVRCPDCDQISHDNDPCNLITLCSKHHSWADYNMSLSIPMLDNLIMMMYGPDYR